MVGFVPGRPLVNCQHSRRRLFALGRSGRGRFRRDLARLAQPGAVLSAAVGTFNKPTLPTVALITIAGESVNLTTLAKGQPIVVNLWASWCPPCRREMPVLAAAQQRETGVTFVFANQAEGADTALRYLRTHAFTLANVVFDPRAKLGRAVGSTGLPTTLFYDASGRLVNAHLGELSPASLASQLHALRKPVEPASPPHK